jgi:hypothetical protein
MPVHFTLLQLFTLNPYLNSVACNYILNPLAVSCLVSLQVTGSSFYGPVYEEIFTNICSLFPTPNFRIMIVPSQVA